MKFKSRSALHLKILMLVIENSYGECGGRQRIDNEVDTHSATADKPVVGSLSRTPSCEASKQVHYFSASNNQDLFVRWRY